MCDDLDPKLFAEQANFFKTSGQGAKKPLMVLISTVGKTNPKDAMGYVSSPITFPIATPNFEYRNSSRCYTSHEHLAAMILHVP